MSEVAEDRIAKLPKWAQDHIDDLERTITNQKTFIDGLLEVMPKSRVMVPHFDQPTVYMDNDVRIRFDVTDFHNPAWTNPLEVRFDYVYRKNDPCAAISLSSREGRLLIMSEASNTARIAVLR